MERTRSLLHPRQLPGDMKDYTIKKENSLKKFHSLYTGLIFSYRSFFYFGEFPIYFLSKIIHFILYIFPFLFICINVGTYITAKPMKIDNIMSRVFTIPDAHKL